MRGLFTRAIAERDAIEDFSEYQLRELGHSPATVRCYAQQLRAVAQMLDKPVTKVSIRDLRYDVKRDTSVAASTTQLRIVAYRQLHMWGLVDERPWANAAMLGIRPPRSKRRLSRPPISPLDAKKLLANCRNANEYRLVYLGLYAGLRVAESASIRAEHIHRDRLVFVGKGDKERTVPIHPELAKVLPTILLMSPKSKGVLMGRMRDMQKRLGIRDLQGEPATSHSLRRTFADTLYSHLGVEKEVVAMILGHGGDVTSVYAPVRFPKMKECIERLDYSMGEPIQMSLF